MKGLVSSTRLPCELSEVLHGRDFIARLYCALPAASTGEGLTPRQPPEPENVPRVSNGSDTADHPSIELVRPERGKKLPYIGQRVYIEISKIIMDHHAAAENERVSECSTKMTA